MLASASVAGLFSVLALLPVSFASGPSAVVNSNINIAAAKPALPVRDLPQVPRRLAKSHAHRRAAKKCSVPNNSTSTDTTLPGGEKPNVDASSSKYKLTESWSGSSFFDDWNFYNSADPTHGQVDYVSESEAKNSKLAYVSNGVAYMKVDSTSNLGSGQKRKSVRIASSKRFDGGLFIADIAHMPTGLATWPAFWTVGQNWPNHGEIDIIEGVNNNVQNQYTVHSAPGCQIDTSSTAPEGFKVNALSSSVSHPSCGSSKGSNNGCAFIDDSKASYGAPFNKAGGGTYAMEWTSSGIKIWSFPRGQEPADLEGNPNPSGWAGKFLKAAWSSHSCDTKTFFKQHAVTFDTTLCGDWAGSAYPGGKSKCQEYVKTGSHFTEAYWAINSVRVYQS